MVLIKRHNTYITCFVAYFHLQSFWSTTLLRIPSRFTNYFFTTFVINYFSDTIMVVYKWDGRSTSRFMSRDKYYSTQERVSYIIQLQSLCFMSHVYFLFFSLYFLYVLCLLYKFWFLIIFFFRPHNHHRLNWQSGNQLIV